MISISRQIRDLRLRKGVEQKELAEKLSVPASLVSRWEKVGYESFTVRTLLRIAAAFGVKLKISFVEKK